MSARFVFVTGLLLLMVGCTSPAPREVVAPVEKEPVSDEVLAEREAVLAQPNIDPITDFIVRLEASSEAPEILAEIIRERDERCQAVHRIYLKRPKNDRNLKRLQRNYQYSCPAMVSRFVADWKSTIPRQPDSKEVLKGCQLALVKNQFLQVIKNCANLAVKGNDTAQVLVASSYREINQYPQAYYWAERAATTSNPDAEFLVGDLLANGQGVAVDYSAALDWKEKAAQQGHLQAQMDVAHYYLRGQGVEQNFPMAKLWFSSAAKKGDVSASVELGKLYLNGSLGKKDFVKGKRFLQQAADQGSREALYRLGQLYTDSEFPDKDQSQAYLWLRLAALSGHPEASRQALLLAQGLGPQELEKADKVYEVLAPDYQLSN